MPASSTVVSPPSRPVALRPRHRFSLLLVAATVALIGWGGFVTSIDAGLAVPDWPTSFNSLDPFNPWPDWWTITPVLAEHGHRLLGATVGLLTLVLAGWTWYSDPRRWMRRLGVAALLLVIAQGVLGGLRVVWVSLDLAMVHAGVAQIFFALTVALALFTSRSWTVAAGAALPAGAPVQTLRRLAVTAAVVLYGQILLGALLRHPGAGIEALPAALHLFGAFAATAAVVGAVLHAEWSFRPVRPVRVAARVMAGGLALQILLGLTAYFVLLDEAGRLQPSNVQVVVNTGHLLVGAFLWVSAVALALLAHRLPAPRARVRVAGPVAADAPSTPVFS